MRKTRSSEKRALRAQKQPAPKRAADRAPRREPRAAVGRRELSSSITGMSGAGKSHAIRALEDLGYYCVDNLPTPLIPVLADLSLHEDADNPKVAVVVDVRERALHPRVSADLAAADGDAADCDPLLIFLEAERRRRCCAASARRGGRIRWRRIGRSPKRSRKSARMLAPIRAMADEIVDTSDLTVHELRQIFQRHGARPQRARAAGAHVRELRLQARRAARRRPRVRLPVPAQPALRRRPARARRARTRAVATYMRRHPDDARFHAAARAASCATSCRTTSTEGKAYLTVAIGCTGGRHRSVYLAEVAEAGAGRGLKNVIDARRAIAISRRDAS